MARLPIVPRPEHRILIASVAHRAALDLDEEVTPMLLYGDHGPAFSLIPGYSASGDAEIVSALRALAVRTTRRLREV